MDEYYYNFLVDNDCLMEIIWFVNFDGDVIQMFGGIMYFVYVVIGGVMNVEDYGVNNGWGGLCILFFLVDCFFDEIGNIDEWVIFFIEG